MSETNSTEECSKDDIRTVISCFEFRKVTRLKTDLETLEGAAIGDLQNLFSCYKASLSSSRRELLLDCAKEYLKVLQGKIEYARKLACLIEAPCTDAQERQFRQER